MSDYIFDLAFKVDESDIDDVKRALKDVNLEIQDINKKNGEIKIRVNNKEMNLTAQQIAKIKTTMEQASREGKDFGVELSRIGLTKTTKETAVLTNKLKDLQDGMKDAAKRSKQAEQEIKEFSRAAQQAAVSIKTADSAFEQLRNNMAQGLGQTVAFGAIAGFGTAFVSAIQETMELDKVLTDLQIVSEGTAQDMEAMADSAFELAGGLGTTGQKFLEASLIFEQQGGLAAQYSKEMAEATVIASNVTGQSMDEMSDQITAVANGYKLLEERGGDAGLYITDVMAKLGAVSGSSLDEMAAALQRTATVADLAGYSFEEVTAQIATVSEVTRRSPEVIGTAFKSIILSFQQLREAGDEELNAFSSKVEEAFKLSGMEADLSIFDDQGNLRDARDIMIDIAGEWDKMSKEGKALISESVAGKEQAEVFAVLMENWERSQGLITEAQNAQGTALEQQEIYMDSIQAKTEALANEWGELIHNIVDSDLFKGLLEGMTGFLEGFNNIESTIGKIAALMGPIIAGAAAFFNAGENIGQIMGQSNLEKQQEAIRAQYENEKGMAGERVRREQELIKIRENLGDQAASLYNQEKSHLDILQKRLEMNQTIETSEEKRQQLQKEGEAIAKAGLAQEIDLNAVVAQSQTDIKNSIDARSELNRLIKDGADKEYNAADIADKKAEFEKNYGVQLGNNINSLQDMYKKYGIIISEQNMSMGAVKESLKYQERMDDELNKQLDILEKISTEELQRGEAVKGALQQEVNRTQEMTTAIEGAADKSQKWATAVNLGVGALGGLSSAIPLFQAMTDEATSLEEKMDTFGNSLLTLAPTMAFMFAPPAGLFIGAGLAIAALVAKFVDFSNEVEKATKANEELSKTLSELRKGSDDMRSALGNSGTKEYIEGLSMSQDELNKKLKESGETQEAYNDRMKAANEAAQARIAEIAPHLISYYDSEGKAVVNVAEAYEILNKEYQRNQDLQNSLTKANISNYVTEYSKTLEDNNKTLVESSANLKEYKEGLDAAIDSGDRKKVEEFNAKIAESQEKISGANKALSDLNGEINQNLVLGIKESNEAFRTLDDSVKGMTANLINSQEIMDILGTSLNPEKEINDAIRKFEVYSGTLNSMRISQDKTMAGAYDAIGKMSQTTQEYMINALSTVDQTVAGLDVRMRDAIQNVKTATTEAGEVFFIEPLKVEDIVPKNVDGVFDGLTKEVEGLNEEIKGLEASKAGLEEVVQLMKESGAGSTAYTSSDQGAYADKERALQEINRIEREITETQEEQKNIQAEISREKAKYVQTNVEEVAVQQQLNNLFLDQVMSVAQTAEGHNAILTAYQEEVKLLSQLTDGASAFVDIMAQDAEKIAEIFDNELVENFEESIGNIGTSMGDFAEQGEEALEIMEDLADDGVGPTIEGLEDMKDSLEDTMHPFADLNDYVDDFTDKDWDSLLDVFPEMASQIEQVRDGIDSLGDAEALDELGNAFNAKKEQIESMYLAMKQDDAGFWAQVMENNQANVEQSFLDTGILMSNYATAAEARMAIQNNEANNAIFRQNDTLNATVQAARQRTLTEVNAAKASGNAGAAGALLARQAALESQLAVAETAKNTAKSTITAIEGIDSSMELSGKAVVAEALDKAKLAVVVAEQQIKDITAALAESGLPDAANDIGADALGALGNLDLGNVMGDMPTFKPVGGGGGGGTSSPGKTPSGGKGSGGKGGKGDKGGKEKEVADVELNIDPYKYINEVIEDIEDALGRVQEAQDEAFGDEKRKLMEDEMGILKQQLASQEALYNLQKDDLSTRAKRLESYGFELDAMGNIANYNEKIIQLTNDVNSKKGQEKEIAKEQLKFVQEQVKEFEKLREEAQKMGDEMKEIRKELEQTYLDYITSFKDEADEASELLNDIWDLQDDINDGFDGIGVRFGNAIDRVQDGMDNVKNSMALINQIQNDATLSDGAKEEKLKELYKDIIKEVGDLNEAYKELQELQIEAMEEGIELFEEEIDKIKQLNDNMEDFGDLLSDIYGDAAYEDVLELNKLQLKGIEDQMAGYDQMIANTEAYLGTLEEGSEAWKATKKELDDLNQNQLELSIQKVEKLKEIADQMFEKAQRDLEEALFGPGGLDAFEEKFDKVNEDQDKYLNNLEKARQISALTAQIEKEIAATNDPKKKAQLNKFLQDQLKLLNEKDRLTATDVERAELLYQLELQKLALNERQQALMTAQLTRDESGGFSYQYVKEPSKKKGDEENDSALDDLIALDQKALDDNAKAIKDVQTKLFEDIKKLDQDAPDYNEQLAKLQAEADKEMRRLEAEQLELIKNAQQSGSMGILDAFKDTESLEMFGGNVDKTLNALADAVANGSIEFNDIMNKDFEGLAEKTGMSAAAIEEAYNAMIGATTEDWEESNEAMGISSENLAQAVQDYIDAMTNDEDGYGYYKDKVTEAIGAHEAALGDLDTAMNTNQENMQETINKVNATTTEMGKLNTSIGGPDGLKAQLDKVNTVIGSTGNKDSFLGKLEAITKDAKKEDNGLIQTGKNADLAKEAMKRAETGSNNLKTQLKGMSSDAKTAINAMWEGSKASLENTINKIKGVGSAADGAAKAVGSAADKIAGSAAKIGSDVNKINNMRVTGPKDSPKRVGFVSHRIQGGPLGTSVMVHSKTGVSRRLQGDFHDFPPDMSLPFEKGGYTGEGGRSGGIDGIGGMPAVLHPNEFVMNKEITAKMITGVGMIEHFAKLLKQESLIKNPVSSGFIPGGGTPVLQDINIKAEFPNANNRSEIEDTFRNLSNLSLQWAHSTKSSK